MQLNSHLHFSGQCEEAFKFYEKYLGGKIDGLFRFAEAPGAEEQNVLQVGATRSCMLI